MENIRNIDTCRMVKQHITDSNKIKKKKEREGEREGERRGDLQRLLGATTAPEQSEDDEIGRGKTREKSSNVNRFSHYSMRALLSVLSTCLRDQGPSLNSFIHKETRRREKVHTKRSGHFLLHRAP